MITLIWFEAMLTTLWNARHGCNMAERQGFEPWIPCGIHAFQACAFSHSAISPRSSYLFEGNTIVPAMDEPRDLSKGPASQSFPLSLASPPDLPEYRASCTLGGSMGLSS